MSVRACKKIQKLNFKKIRSKKVVGENKLSRNIFKNKITIKNVVKSGSKGEKNRKN